MQVTYPKVDPRLHNILCMVASDHDWLHNAISHTRDPTPGATRQTFRCVGGTPCPMGLICNLSGSPPFLPMSQLEHSIRGSKMRTSNRWLLTFAKCRKLLRRSQETDRRLRSFSSMQNAKTWEGAARTLGLFLPYVCC